MTSRFTTTGSQTHSPPLFELIRTAWADEGTRAQAVEALALFRSYCSEPPPRIPGCDTILRIALRIHSGASVEAAAAREYSYRWHLFLDAWVNHVETRSRSYFAHGPVIYPAPNLLGQ